MKIIFILRSGLIGDYNSFEEPIRSPTAAILFDSDFFDRADIDSSNYEDVALTSFKRIDCARLKMVKKHEKLNSAFYEAPIGILAIGIGQLA